MAQAGWKGDCSKRVVRGGSWYSQLGDLRSANRGWDGPDDQDNNRGFRVAGALTPEDLDRLASSQQ